MVQVANKAVGADIGSPIDVSVYGNRQDQTVSVVVNGYLAFSYTDPDLFTSGSSVALRTPGSAGFSSLTVKAP